MKNDKLLKSMKFLPKQQSVLIAQEESILDLALKHKIEINHSCGGMGSCGTCRVFIETNHFSSVPRNELELEISLDRKMLENERLACQFPPLEGLVVTIPDSKI